MIRIFQPTLGRRELAAIANVFRDQWPGSGPRVKAFEQAFADYIGCNSEEVIAVTSCTEGLFQSIAALQLEKDHEVVLPTVSFIGAAHAVRASGARLPLVDVDPVTLNPRLDHIENALSSKTKAILLLHFGGRLEWMQDVADLAKQRSITLIEDSACSLGGTCNGKPYGLFGDVGVWSFDAMKLLVTGDGGMVRVRDAALRNRLLNAVTLGGVKTGLDQAARHRDRWWEFEPVCVGRRSTMNDLAAAIGLTQLPRISSFIELRRRITRAYDDAFKKVPWIQLPLPRMPGDVPYFYWLQTAACLRDRLARHLRERGIYTTFRYWPLHLTALYADGASYPGADLASETTLLLPIHQNLTDVEVNHVVESVITFDGQ